MTRSLPITFFIFTLLALAGCSQKELTDEDRAKLPTLAEVRELCPDFDSRDVNVSITNVPLMKKTTRVSASKERGCKTVLNVTITEFHSRVLSSGSYAELSGAAMGMKASGVEIKNMNARREGLRGRYFNVYREEEYAGLVYSSYDKSGSLFFMILSLPQEFEDSAFELIGAMEERNLEPETADS